MVHWIPGANDLDQFTALALLHSLGRRVLKDETLPPFR